MMITFDVRGRPRVFWWIIDEVAHFADEKFFAFCWGILNQFCSLIGERFILIEQLNLFIINVDVEWFYKNILE